MSALAALLRRHREQARWTQEELAERSGVSTRTVSDVERGLRSRLYPDTAERLARALSLPDVDRAAFLEVARGREPVATPPRSFRRPLTPLVGREAELSEIIGSLRAGRRLVAITGLGGLGKTRLALAAAERLDKEYDGRVHFLAVPPGLQPQLLPGLIATSVGASDRPQALAAYLARRPTLVIVDSFEHAPAAAPELERLLLEVPELHVLATSRERLRITGEHDIALRPLVVPDPANPAWAEAPAVQLFLERARDVRPDLEPDRDSVIDICRRLSGLPLALELAAARVRHLPLGLLRERLQHGLGGLSLDSEHGSMTETLRWSINSLTREEALVLRACALFPAGARLDAAQALCPDEVDVLHAISGLVDKNLVLLDNAYGEDADVARWRMLDVVREFALAESGGVDARQHAAYQQFFIELLTTTALSMGRGHEWFRVRRAEEDNVRAALHAAASDRDAETLLRLANGMWFYWQTRGALVEGRRWLETGLSIEPPATEQTRMTALWGDAWLAYHQADDVSAERCATELHVLASRTGDQLALRNAATIRGMVAIAREQPAEAVRLLDEALRLAQRVEDEWILATSLLNLGLAHLSGRDVDAARSAFGEALTMYAELDDERFHARCLGYLGMASLLEDDPGRARSLYAESLRTFDLLAEPAGSAEALTGLAGVEAAMGELERAAVLSGAAARLRESFQGRELPLDERTTSRYLARARERLGDEAWLQAWQHGRGLSLAQAVETALTLGT